MNNSINKNSEDVISKQLKHFGSSRLQLGNNDTECPVDEIPSLTEYFSGIFYIV